MRESLKRTGTNYTPKEIGEKAGIHYTVVYHYIDTGELQAINIGQGTKRPRWVIFEDDAEEFLSKYKKNIGTSGKKARTIIHHKEETVIEEVSEERNERKEKLVKEFYLVKETMLDLAIRLERIEKELKEL